MIEAWRTWRGRSAVRVPVSPGSGGSVCGPVGAWERLAGALPCPRFSPDPLAPSQGLGVGSKSLRGRHPVRPEISSVAWTLAPFMGHHQYGVLAREVNDETKEIAPPPSAWTVGTIGPWPSTPRTPPSSAPPNPPASTSSASSSNIGGGAGQLLAAGTVRVRCPKKCGIPRSVVNHEPPASSGNLRWGWRIAQSGSG